MDQQSLAKVIIGIGVLLVLAGAIYYWAGERLGWLGRLPGDIRIERENFRFYFPITTMLLISVLLNVIVRIVKRFL